MSGAAVARPADATLPGIPTVATDAPPKRVRQLFINTQAVGQAFGVILVRLGRSVVEVATVRAALGL